jgi:hypothetical protein
VDKHHQQVPETAQLWTMVMEFEEAGVPMTVALAKHLLGNVFNVIVANGKVLDHVAEIQQLHLTV